MTREELLCVAKPIILDDISLKCVVKDITYRGKYIFKKIAFPNDYLTEVHNEKYPNGWKFEGRTYESWGKLPYLPFEKFCKYGVGDILYVKESWKQGTVDYFGGGSGLTDIYLYKVDESNEDKILAEDKWHSASTMPKDASRIFLQITNIKLERIQDEVTINLEDTLNTYHDIFNEFVCNTCNCRSLIAVNSINNCRNYIAKNSCAVYNMFKTIWNKGLKKSQYDIYNWDNNPWVLIFEYEKII